MKVKEIMTTRVVTVTRNTPVPVIASLLRDNRISGVPVVGRRRRGRGPGQRV